MILLYSPFLRTMFLILFSLPLFANTEDDKKPDENEEEEKKIITIADETKSASKIDGLFMLYQDTTKGNSRKRN